jgi:RND family efflux transporter MFP subunit
MRGTGRLYGGYSGITCALLALLALLSTACGKREQAAVAVAENAALTVKTARLEARPLPLTVTVTGTLVSSASVDVKAETTGRLLSFAKQEGDMVAANEIVASVEEENYKLSLRQAQTAVQVAEASLARARVLASHAGSELERSRNLVRSGGITTRDLEAAQLSERDAQAQVAVAEAQVAQAKAAQDAADKRLRDTAIRAPVSGAIQRKYLNPGAYLEPPTLVFSLVDNSQLELESPVPSGQLAELRTGQTVSFTVNSYPGMKFDGRIAEVNPAVDALTRSAKVRIRVDNRGGKLRAGMFAQGEILTGVEHQAIVVPAASVFRAVSAGQESYVFVVEGGKAVRRVVELGRETDSQLEIKSGLKTGDVLIAEQRIELADGVRVSAGE